MHGAHYNTYNPTKTTVTKTTIREFDANENCIKETVTEVTETTGQHWQPYYTNISSSSGNAQQAYIKATT